MADPTTVPDRGLVTDWLVALLSADAGGYGVGDHGPPAAPVEYPYWSVWSIPGGEQGGPALGAAAADASLAYQVDSVGLTRAQSERLAARAAERVAGRRGDGSYAAAAADPAGMRVLDRMVDGSAGAPVPEGDRPNEVWTTSARFVIHVSATGA